MLLSFFLLRPYIWPIMKHPAQLQFNPDPSLFLLAHNTHNANNSQPDEPSPISSFRRLNFPFSPSIRTLRVLSTSSRMPRSFQPNNP